MRRSAKLESLEERLLAARWLTSHQIAVTLGVGRTTISRRRRAGRLQGRICNACGEWLYWPPTHRPPEVHALDVKIEDGRSGSRRTRPKCFWISGRANVLLIRAAAQTASIVDGGLGAML